MKYIMQIKFKNIILCILGSAILSFGLYNVHSLSGVTEGGILGMTLLLDHWLKISPAVSGLILNILCYLFGWRTLGRSFIIYSTFACLGFSATYAVFEMFPRAYPPLADMPFAAALLGAVFVGVGVGLCVRAGGAPGGDDALAMSISKLINTDIRWVYICTDIIVLIMSLSYLDFKRIAFSLLTVILSGQIIGFVQQMDLRAEKVKCIKNQTGEEAVGE